MAPSFFSSVGFCVIGSITLALALPPTEPPLINDHSFVAIWNAPVEHCKRLHIPLDTAAFQSVTTPAAVPGQFLTIFYEDRLGHYPRADSVKHKLYSGGVPQNGNLTEHLARAQKQIDHYISQDSSPGLAVIDWESWRPLWDQNWGSKRIYQKLSISHTLQMLPFLSLEQILKLAKKQFQRAGRHFMEKTISLGTGERPNRRWGFYLFPDCYNYGWNKLGYTGECSHKTHKQNNQMLWLWERSTALFPSVYLHQNLRNSPQAALFVRNRVLEALRVAALPKRPYVMPVYVYCRPLVCVKITFMHIIHFIFMITINNLISTIGESAALGASGVIIWGGASCDALSKYLRSTLNPYIANVTAAAKLCSEVLCQGKGRCVRKSNNSRHYLKYVAIGLPSAADLSAWAENFTCQCYYGHKAEENQSL
uniref:Hyaluronidase n=1 Tax=Pundamilia nyererei TaxID=303518 RepID=A0A3B4FU74_9CICH